MKAKDAYKLLERYSGNDLFQEASKLFQSEVDSLIVLRSHGKPPTINLIDGSIKQVNDWFRKVANGLQWSEPELIDKIIEWGRGKIWVRYKMIDPKLLEWRERTQKEIHKGTPLPILAGFLEAASSMMLARIQEEAKQYLEVDEKRRTFATEIGKKLCPYGIEERLCKHSSTYSLVGEIPTSINDLVFICSIEKCIKEG